MHKSLNSMSLWRLKPALWGFRALTKVQAGRIAVFSPNPIHGMLDNSLTIGLLPGTVDRSPALGKGRCLRGKLRFRPVA